MNKKIISIWITLALMMVSLGAILSTNADEINTCLGNTPPGKATKPYVEKLYHIKTNEFAHTPKGWTLPEIPLVIKSEAYDKDGDEITFVVDFGDGSEKQRVQGEKSVWSEENEFELYVEHQYWIPYHLSKATYSIRVKAVDNNHHESECEWSETTEITVLKNPYENEFEFNTDFISLSPPSTRDDSNTNVLVFRAPCFRESYDENNDEDKKGTNIIIDDEEKISVAILLREETGEKHLVFHKEYIIDTDNDKKRYIRDGGILTEYNQLKEGFESDFDYKIQYCDDQKSTFINVFLPKEIISGKLIISAVFPAMVLEAYTNENELISLGLTSIEYSSKLNTRYGITVEGDVYFKGNQIPYLKAEVSTDNYNYFTRYESDGHYVLYADHPGNSTEYTIRGYSDSFWPITMCETEKVIGKIDGGDLITNFDLHLKASKCHFKSKNILSNLLNRDNFQKFPFFVILQKLSDRITGI